MSSLYSLVTVSKDLGPSTDPVNSDGLKTMCPMEDSFSAAASKAERDDHVIDRAALTRKRLGGSQRSPFMATPLSRGKSKRFIERSELEH